MSGTIVRRAIVAIALFGCGCTAWEAAPRARTVAAEILRCPEVELAQRAENVWHATGCGGEIDVACSSGNNEPHCERVRIRGSASVVPGELPPRAPAGTGTETASGTESGSPTATTTPAATATSPADADALREAIEARRDDVLACASRDRVAVHVRTDANGAAAVTLGGELAGSPEEGCVRAALSDLRGPPSADVIHLLRR